MRAIPSLAIVASCFATLSVVAQTPPSADQVLTKAKAKAAEEHKNIFVIFDASW